MFPKKKVFTKSDTTWECEAPKERFKNVLPDANRRCVLL